MKDYTLKIVDNNFFLLTHKDLYWWISSLERNEKK